MAIDGEWILIVVVAVFGLEWNLFTAGKPVPEVRNDEHIDKKVMSHSTLHPWFCLILYDYYPIMMIISRFIIHAATAIATVQITSLPLSSHQLSSYTVISMDKWAVFRMTEYPWSITYTVSVFTCYCRLTWHWHPQLQLQITVFDQ
jgi:hypothetical protein